MVIDLRLLFEAVEADRTRRGLSQRGIAAEIGVSASLLTRRGTGQTPDTPSFMTIVAFLDMPAERFVKAQQSAEDG